MNDHLNPKLPILGQNDQTALSACSFEDEVLIKEGWERKFIADERMARESEAMYLELGFEVKRVPFDTTVMPGNCQGCEIVVKKFCVLYTRKQTAK